jgi:hypothetical protein
MGINMRKILNWKITEKQRTLILVLLLAFAVGFIFWTKNSYSSNFVEGF